MRMKNRFSRMGNTLLGAMCLLSTCGITYSCSDDYDLDETMPSYLGGSIYDELKARKFTNVVRLIDDLDYKNVLSKTGSKTLFVAPDSAYDRFYATTSWKDANGDPVRSYEQLTTAQKRILLYNTMLNNAQVLEMLSYSSGDGNLTMRRTTAASAIDSVKYWKWNELPDNLNEGEESNGVIVSQDARFWDKYRTQAYGGLLMATDATNPVMVHFVEDQMKEKNITHSDIGFMMNSDWLDGADGGNRTYIYDARVMQRNVVCMNGYLNILDKVLITPPNMAEAIRQNPKTQLYSQMLDRFSAPYYNYELTTDYKALYDIGNDSVFEKRYLASRTHNSQYSNVGHNGAFAMLKTPDNKNMPTEQPLLTFDPGWNQYAISSTTPMEQDMGVMYAPSDQALKDYFVNGGGRVLMNRYAKRPNTEENLSYNLYQVPLDILAALINNLMKDSFNESVPSKFLTIMNDAQDQMFPKRTYPTVESYKAAIDTTLLATNGVVFVMNTVISPADYASVIAPALYSKNTQIIKTVIRGDDKYIEGSNAYAAAPFKKYYSTYLKAMQSHFSFFVPTDEGLEQYGYIDPMSLAMGAAGKDKNRCWQFQYKTGAGAVVPIYASAVKYNIETGQIGGKLQGGNTNISNITDPLSTGTGAIKRTLLIDMVDQHIIVHDTQDDDNNDGVFAKRRYFLSRTGAPVYIAPEYKESTKNDLGVGMVADGGFQMQLRTDEYAGNEYDCKVIEGYDMTEETNDYGNGMTYLLNRPMQPTTNSVWKIMQSTPEFSEFFELCQSSVDEETLKAMGLNLWEDGTEMKAEDWKSEQNKYRVFYEGVTGSNGQYPAVGEQLIRFFNNYRYTIYVPTNEAIREAYANGLPTAKEIVDFVNNNLEEVEGSNGETKKALSEENKAKAKAMLTMLYNFVKYHFQDESLFVDNIKNEGNRFTDYQTSCIDNEKSIYLPISVMQGIEDIKLTDLNGRTQSVQKPMNVIARDAVYEKNPSTVATQIKSSSYVSLHQVPHVLDFFKLNGGRYDAEWATANKARAFAAKYRIRK